MTANVTAAAPFLTARGALIHGLVDATDLVYGQARQLAAIIEWDAAPLPAAAYHVLEAFRVGNTWGPRRPVERRWQLPVTDHDALYAPLESVEWNAAQVVWVLARLADERAKYDPMSPPFQRLMNRSDALVEWAYGDATGARVYADELPR